MEQSAPVALWNDNVPHALPLPWQAANESFQIQRGARWQLPCSKYISFVYYFLRAFSNWWQLSTRNEPRAHIMMPHHGYPQASPLPQTGCEARQEGLRSWKWAGPSRKAWWDPHYPYCLNPGRGRYVQMVSWLPSLSSHRGSGMWSISFDFPQSVIIIFATIRIGVGDKSIIYT